jgi:dienelactone hydrolase
MFVLLQSLLFAFLVQAEPLLLPSPKGRYHVAHRTAKLVDHSRIDPYDPEGKERNVMISVFYPVERSVCSRICAVEYMPARTASVIDSYAVANYGVPDGTMEDIKMTVCCEMKPNKAPNRHQKYPVVLFSPGLTNSRLQYNYHAASVASQGYAVVTVDHAFDGIIVEYPDGSFVSGMNDSYWYPDPNDWLSGTELFEAAVDHRIADAQFVLQQLKRESVVKRLIHSGASVKSLDTSHAAFYGHSFGGASAVASLTDRFHSEFAGAINLDGYQFGVRNETSRPVFLFGREDHAENAWEPSWPYYKGWKREISLAGSKHNTFGGDLAMIFKMRDVPINAQVEKTIGTLDANRGFDIIVTYVKAFLDFVLKGSPSGLLERPSDAYPEVSFK